MQGKQKNPLISIIIPTLNEEDSIGETIQRISDDVKRYSEILVVDGLSDDDTITEATKNGARVVLEKERGKGMAMRTGARSARGDILVFIDGDGTHPSEDILQFIHLLDEYDLIIGNALPFLRQMKSRREKFLHHYSSYLLSKFLFSLVGVNLEDPLDGMRVIRKSDFTKLNLRSIGFEIETEMNLKAKQKGLKIVEVPIKLRRRKSRSKFVLNFKDQLKIVSMILSSRNSNFTQLPFR